MLFLTHRTVVSNMLTRASSTATNCSCVYSATGKLAHTCTALSYNSQTIVAPKQDAATQSADLMSVGAQFDDAK